MPNIFQLLLGGSRPEQGVAVQMYKGSDENDPWYRATTEQMDAVATVFKELENPDFNLRVPAFSRKYMKGLIPSVVDEFFRRMLLKSRHLPFDTYGPIFQKLLKTKRIGDVTLEDVMTEANSTPRTPARSPNEALSNYVTHRDIIRDLTLMGLFGRRGGPLTILQFTKKARDSIMGKGTVTREHMYTQAFKYLTRDDTAQTSLTIDMAFDGGVRDDMGYKERKEKAVTARAAERRVPKEAERNEKAVTARAARMAERNEKAAKATGAAAMAKAEKAEKAEEVEEVAAAQPAARAAAVAAAAVVAAARAEKVMR